MAGTIYLVTNTLNGKQYVGQTIVANNRVGHGSLVTKAYRKHGKRNFTYELLCGEIANRPTLNFMERFWISVMNSQVPNGYNIENGGSSKGKTAESTKEKLRQIATGFKHTEETKRKIAIASANRSAETKAKLSLAKTGRIFTDEVKAKIAESNKGQKRSEETCKRIGLSKTGIKASAETRAKMSAAHKARYAKINQQKDIS
jgi:group I intron endonuclease